MYCKILLSELNYDDNSEIQKNVVHQKRDQKGSCRLRLNPLKQVSIVTISICLSPVLDVEGSHSRFPDGLTTLQAHRAQ